MVGKRKPAVTFLSAWRMSRARMTGRKIRTYSFTSSSSAGRRGGIEKCSKVSLSSTGLLMRYCLTLAQPYNWDPQRVELGITNNFQIVHQLRHEFPESH